MKINSLSFLFQQHALESFKLHPHWLLSICCLGDLPHLLHKGLLHISEFVFQVADVSRCLFTLYWYCISQVAVGTLSCGELWATSRTELMAIQFVCFNYQKITGKQISKGFMFLSLSLLKFSLEDGHLLNSLWILHPLSSTLHLIFLHISRSVFLYTRLFPEYNVLFLYDLSFCVPHSNHIIIIHSFLSISFIFKAFDVFV